MDAHCASDARGLRRIVVVAVSAIPFLSGASFRSANFTVDAPSREAAQSAGSSSTGSRQAQCGLARSLAEPLAAGAGWRFRHHSLRFDFQRTAVTDWPVFAYSAAEAFAYLINRRTSAPDLGKHSGDGRDP